jgi:flagellar hook-associated protein 1 FlgK
MSDLLGIGLSGVRAYKTALATVSDNVANAENPGYVRRDVRLAEGINNGSRSPIYAEGFTFGGVEADSISRAWDAFRAADSRFAASASARADTREQWLDAIEGALGDGASAVGARIGAFFNAGEALAATPNDRLARNSMLMALDTAAGTIRETAERLQRVSQAIEGAAKIEVDALNGDLASLAEVNVALKQSAAGRSSRASLEDERDRLIDSIAQRIDVQASFGANGEATLTLGRITGVTLLEPGDRAVISVAASVDGRIQLRMFAGGSTSPLPATGGRLSALVDVAASASDQRAELDTLAQQFVTDVNGWNANGRTAAGLAGGPLLTMPGGALSIALATSDPAAIAAASGSGAENGNLLALGELRGAGSAEARWAALVAAQAQTLNSVRSEAAAASTRRDGAFAARDEISGVDLDREAAELLRYQRAYDGSAKIIQVARDTMQTILDLF